MNKIMQNNTFVRALTGLLFLAFFSELAQAQTVPKKSQVVPKQIQPALQKVRPEPGIPPFDHAKTGFLLRDVHATLRCEQCHVDGIFKNTPKDCGGCHAIGSRVAATPKPVNHVQTTSSCDTCHVSPTTFLVASFKHIGINSGCKSCHNGQSLGVVSKPVNHFPTLLPCESCHTNTTTFSSARMDHTGITTGCASCHSGQFANVVSKPASHIATTASCEACHSSTITFLGATYGHDLATVTNNCISCHGGPMPGVVGKPATHLSTTAQCDQCHTQANTGNFTTFLGAVYNHAGAAGICSTCHNGSVAGALGKPANHIATTAQCDTCHTQTVTLNYTTFLGAVYNHGTITQACSSCHNGVSATGKPVNHIPYTPTSTDCVSCHTQTNTNNYTTFLGATYTHGVVAGICSTCHGGTYPGVKSKPANHMVTTAQCDTCHTQSNTANYTTFLGAGVAHTAAMAGTCQTCHNGVGAKGQSAGHIPTGSLSCDGCHAMYTPPTVSTFYPGVMNHTLVPASRCDSCHNGAYTSQGIAGGAQPKVTNHIPTTITGAGDCKTGGCHNITLSANSSAMSWLTESMNHNNAQGMGVPIYCVTCHLSGTTYLGSMQKKSHNGASVAKDCSSSSCHRPLGRIGTPYTNWN